MIPYKTSISLDRFAKRALYQQLSNQLIALIKNRTLRPGAKLPSSRALSNLLGVHRNTVIAGYDELLLQGWTEVIPRKGTYVHQNIPMLQQQGFSLDYQPVKTTKPSFSFIEEALFDRPIHVKSEGYQYLNDGISDARLTPVKDITKEYRSLANRKSSLEKLTYGSTYGNSELRSVLVNYLNETRGLRITKEQVLITRGSQMGLYLASRVLFNQQNFIIVGETNYISADLTFSYNGAKLLRVPVDQNGMDTKAVELLCKKHSITAVYVTSHHHHPTTVTLSAQRRMHLLNLAHTYRFAIIEDDYDYDFHYDHAPILPIASHDLNGNVIYVGSICKTIAPAYRIGYLIADKSFVDQCANLRRYVDRQGDPLLEATFARFIENGDLDRHIRRVLKIYKKRRDLFCKILTDDFDKIISFEIPKGGMAIWTVLPCEYSWDTLAKNAPAEGLIIGEWQRYDRAHMGHNGIRMGFAAYNEIEIYSVMKKLRTTFKKSYPDFAKS